MGIGSGTNYTTTPAMGLFQPIPGQCGALGVEPAGKSWLELLNTGLGLIDGHTHAPGFGTPVPTAGLNINADLAFGGFNATALRSARFSAVSLGALTAADVGCIVVSGADLYYVDGSANQVRLTSGGGVAGTPGSINNLAAPAVVNYTAASKLFTFLGTATTYAGIACGSVAVGDASVSNGKAATLAAPAGLAANYTITLPSSLPGAASFLTLDASGNLASGAAVTAGLTAANLSPTANIAGSQLAAAAGIAGSQLAANTVTRSQLSAVGQQVSASSGSFTTSSFTFVDVLTVALTTTGRAVRIDFQPDGTAPGVNGGYPSVTGSGWGFRILRDGVMISEWVNQGSPFVLPFLTDYLDAGAAAGAHTYKLQAFAGSGTMTVQNVVMVAYEL